MEEQAPPGPWENDRGPATAMLAPRRLACLPCSRAKYKCDLNVPCSRSVPKTDGRCFKHCLSCLQVVPRARTSSNRAQGGTAAGAKKGSHGDEDGGGAEDGGIKHRGRRRRRLETPALDATPIVELCIARTDPGVTAGAFIESFFKVMATGQILRDNVIALMRTWRLWNLAAGTDLSWGAIDALSMALNVTPVEVEGPEEVMHDAPQPERQRRAQMFMMGLRTAANAPLSQVAAGLPYSSSDEAVPTLVTVFKPGDTVGGDNGLHLGHEQQHEGASKSPPWMTPSVAHALSRFRQWSNPACAQMVKGVAEIQGDLLRYRALQFYLLMGLFAPEDRAVLCEHYHRGFFTDTRQGTCFVKASLSDGRVRLYIQRCRRIPLPDGRVAVLHQIEPCPKSRHMTATPDTSHAILRHFRSSKALEAEGKPSQPLVPPTPAVSAAAVAWAEGQQHAIMSATATASDGSASESTAVAFPALAGLPAAPALGREVEQAAVQVLEWQATGAEGGGQDLPDIFKKPPPSPRHPLALPSLAAGGEEEEQQQPLQYRPATAAWKRGAGAEGAAAAGAGSVLYYASPRAIPASTMRSGLGGGTRVGDMKVKREPFATTATTTDNLQASSSALSGYYPMPAPPLPSPTPTPRGGPGVSPTLFLHPDGGGEPVPIFEGEAELLRLALFDEEGEWGEGGGAAGGRGAEGAEGAESGGKGGVGYQ